MDDKFSWPIIIRLLAGVAGLFVGSVFATLLLIAAMIVSGNNFGFTSIIPVAIVGASLGLLLGLWLPKPVARALYILSKWW